MISPEWISRSKRIGASVLWPMVCCTILWTVWRWSFKIVFYWRQLEERFFTVSEKGSHIFHWWAEAVCVCVCVELRYSLFQVMHSSANWTLNQTLCCRLSVWSLVNHPGLLCATSYRHPSLNMNFVFHWLSKKTHKKNTFDSFYVMFFKVDNCKIM